MTSRSLSSVNVGGEEQTFLTADDIAAIVGGTVSGNGNVVVNGVAPLDRATQQELSFCASERYAAWFLETKAAAVVVSPSIALRPTKAQVLIVVNNPVDAMVMLLSRFHPGERRALGVHPSAIVADSANVGEGVTIEPFAVVGEGAVIGDGCWIGAGAVVGEYCTLSSDVRIHASAHLYPRVQIGNRVVVHSGARIGREGFGFAPSPTGARRVPHIGRCVLSDDVEVGANSCIDRGSVDDTIIGAGTKIDNLVHIAHNVRIGRMCFIAAQTGIAGSSRVGDGVQMGGQVGVSGHINIGDRVSLAAQTGVIGDVPSGETWSGYPARPHREQLRAQASVHRLAGIIRQLEKLLGSTANSEDGKS